MVAWADEQITSRDPRLTFRYFDLQSRYVEWDQHRGTVSAGTFRFPWDDG